MQKALDLMKHPIAVPIIVLLGMIGTAASASFTVAWKMQAFASEMRMNYTSLKKEFDDHIKYTVDRKTTLAPLPIQFEHTDTTKLLLTKQ